MAIAPQHAPSLDIGIETRSHVQCIAFTWPGHKKNCVGGVHFITTSGETEFVLHDMSEMMNT